jgi:hypothetical protein
MAYLVHDVVGALSRVARAHDPGALQQEGAYFGTHLVRVGVGVGVRVRVRARVRVRVGVGVRVGARVRVRKVRISARTTALYMISVYTYACICAHIHICIHIYICTTAFSDENCTSTILPKRLLLLLRVVFALPKASRIGLVPMILPDSAPG